MKRIDSELLDAVLECIIPPSHRMPSASDAGVASFVAVELKRDQEFAKLVDRGLTAIVHESDLRGDRFADHPPEVKDEILCLVESSEPDFFTTLVKHSYGGYYINPEVLALLSEETRAPQPSGYPIDLGDLSLREAVKKRGPIYREL